MNSRLAAFWSQPSSPEMTAMHADPANCPETGADILSIPCRLGVCLGGNDFTTGCSDCG